MKIQSKAEEAVESLINATRLSIKDKSKDPSLSVSLARQTIGAAPQRHEGWRLLIEALCALPGKRGEALAMFQEAEANGKLDNRSRIAQGRNIARASLSALEEVLGCEPSNADLPEGDPLQGVEQLAFAIAASRPLSLKFLREAGRNQGLSPEAVDDLFTRDVAKAAARRWNAHDPITPASSTDTWQAAAGFVFLWEVLNGAGASRRDYGGSLAVSVMKVFPQSLVSLLDSRSTGPTLPSAQQMAPPIVDAQSSLQDLRRTAINLQSKKAFSEAVEVYLKILPIDRSPESVIDRLVVSAREMSDKIAAEAALLRAAEALADMPQNARLLYKLAAGMATLRREGRSQRTSIRLEADDLLRAGLLDNIGDAYLWCEKIRNHIARGELEDADTALDDFARQCPGNPQIPLLRANVLRMTDRLNEAVQSAKEALRHPSADRFSTLVCLGEANLAAGRLACAEQALSAALEIRSDSGVVRSLHTVRACLGLGPPTAQTARKTVSWTLLAPDTALPQDAGTWIILASVPPSEKIIETMLQNARPGDGLFYAAPIDEGLIQAVPPIETARLLALRHADAVKMLDGQGRIDLARVRAGLRAQYVPICEIGAAPALPIPPAAPRGPVLFGQCVGRDVLDAFRDRGEDVSVRVDAEDGRWQALRQVPRCLVLSPSDLPPEGTGGLSAPLVLDLTRVDARERAALDEDLLCPVEPAPGGTKRQAATRLQKAAGATPLGQALRRAAAILVTEEAAVEWLEDRFSIACHATSDAVEAVDRAMAFLRKPIVLHVGAGIGNLLQATPLIRWVSQYQGQPIDVCLNSPVPIAHELFAQSPYVNLAYHGCKGEAGRFHVLSYVASTAGIHPFGGSAERYFLQRALHDFYTQTQTCAESRYYFKGIHHLLGTEEEVANAPLEPFVRQYDTAPGPSSYRRGLRKPCIALAGGKTDALWGKRQWRHFEALAQALRNRGWEVVSIGGPGEEVPGCIDLTGLNLRDTARRLLDVDAVVACDGGMFHLADALRVPTIALFGPTGVIKNGPMIPSTSSIIRSDRSCSPCQFRQEFHECRTALCMEDLDLERVLAEIETKVLKGPLATVEDNGAAQQIDINHVGVLYREQFLEEFLARSHQLLPYLRPSWERALSGAIQARDYDRADHLIAWCIRRDPANETIRYARARLAYLRRDYDAAIAFCHQDDTVVSRQWVLRNLLLRSYIAQRRFEEISTLWQAWGINVPPADDAKAWVDAGTIAVRAFAQLGQTVQARALARTLTDIAGPRTEIEQTMVLSDDTVYRLPSSHFGPEDQIKLRIALLGDWSVRPALLRSFDPRVDVVCLHEEECTLDEAKLIDLFLQPLEGDGDELGMAVGDLVEIGRHIGPEGSWRLLTHDRLPGPVSLDEFLETLGATPSTFRLSQPKRILVVANHHLTNWNPRGGERSTRAILARLRAQGYQTMVVVDNKKHPLVGLEQDGDTPVVVAGQYAFRSSLTAAIARWRPDGAIMYGGSALVAGKVCSEMDVPYVMFPRDWGEVLPKPHLNLTERMPIELEDDVYRSLYRNASSVITNARYVGRVLDHLYQVPSVNSYVPVTPPPPEFEPLPLAERSEILLINARKFGGGALVRALASQRPDLIFRVVGDDGMPFPPNVRVEPFFNGAEYCEMYRNARLFLFPLGDEDPCGTGRVVFEALMCQVPAISLDRGGMSEVLPAKWLTRDNDPQAWLRLMETVLSETPKAAEFEALVGAFNHDRQLSIVDTEIKNLVNRSCKPDRMLRFGT